MKETPYHLCFETLGNDLRIKILSLLAEQPLSVQGISAKTGAKQSTVSHALAELRNCNFISFEASGKERIYTLEKPVLDALGDIKPGTPAFLSVMEEHFKKSCKGRCRKLE